MSISNKIAKSLAEVNIIKEDEIELYEYSVNATLELIGNMILIIIFGIFLNKFLMSILFLGILMPLRSCMGGWHAKRAITCFLLSMLLYFLCMLVPEHILFLNNYLLLILQIICSITIWVLAPVACVEKPVTPRQNKKMRMYTRIILVISELIFLLLWFYDSKIYCNEMCLILFYCVISLVAEKVRKAIFYQKSDRSCAKIDHS